MVWGANTTRCGIARVRAAVAREKRGSAVHKGAGWDDNGGGGGTIGDRGSSKNA